MVAKPKKEYVTVWLPAELKQTVLAKAEEEDRSLSNMLTVLVKRGLKAKDVVK